MSTILKVNSINVYYGNIHAIKDISFEVNEGEIVTLIGANGAGKSSPGYYGAKQVPLNSTEKTSPIHRLTESSAKGWRWFRKEEEFSSK